MFGPSVPSLGFSAVPKTQTYLCYTGKKNNDDSDDDDDYNDDDGDEDDDDDNDDKDDDDDDSDDYDDVKGGSVAEWSARRTLNPAVLGSSPALATCWICSRSYQVQILGHACKKPTGCLLPVEVLNPVMLYLNYLFSKYLLIVKRFGSLRERRYISVYYYYYYY